MNDEGMGGEQLKKEGSKLVYRGEIFSVRKEAFQYADGSRSSREVVVHPGAVCIIPHDGNVIYMVEQPREAIEDPALLELPAGKLDVEGETPLQCAQRELGEEIGKSAGDWRELKTFYTSPGFTNERVWLFLATELYDTPERRHTDERIEIVEFPLARIDEAIERCEDAESLIGLLTLKALL
ncbi:MAG TPA: NUDIX hydrolase [Solirubrobacterales bacterium]|jgi:ADP-ribose pyrophosphatase